MKILTTLLQILLSIWNLIGGVFLLSNYSSLGNTWALENLHITFWFLLGIIQILFSLSLLISINGNFKHLGAPSAVGLAGISLLGLFIYVAYSGFPGILWGIIPALLLGFVAYKRRRFAGSD